MATTHARTLSCWRGAAAASCIRSSACPRACSTGLVLIVRLAVPEASRALARPYAQPGVGIGIIPAGSAAAKMYPDAGTWIAIMHALRARFPDASIYLTGSRSAGRGQTRTAAYSDAEIGCDVVLAPHTGFAFLALCVGTPWLALSGGNWPDNLQ